MDSLSITIATIISIAVYYVIVRLTEDRIARLVNKLPGPIRFPIVGTTYIVLLVSRKDFFEFSEKSLRSYGKIVRTWFGSIPVVHLYTPENVEVVLNNSVQITKSWIYKPLHLWLGDGLLTSTGTKWFKHRKLITPTFHFKILENFMEVFVDKSKELVDILQNEAKAGKTFDLYPYITLCTLDMICETAMGVRINAMQDKENEYVKCIHKISEMTFDRIFSPWLYSDFIYYNFPSGKKYKEHVKYLHSFTNRVIQERRETLKNKENISVLENDVGRKKRKAFLDLFLEISEEDGGFTDREIQEQVDTFMFEGHDTTTAAIAWTLFLLGNHPKIQEEVYQEVEKVFANSSGTLTLPDLTDLKVLERCIKEALRLYPSVPSIGRIITEDVTICDYTIPAGCAVTLELYVLHRDPIVYPEPERFDPDRFLPENSKGRHAYAYIPFSAGPRNCIGQKFAMYEEKTLLAYILKNYKVKSQGTQETVKPLSEIVLRPHNGLQVELERRQ